VVDLDSGQVATVGDSAASRAPIWPASIQEDTLLQLQHVLTPSVAQLDVPACLRGALAASPMYCASPPPPPASTRVDRPTATARNDRASKAGGAPVRGRSGTRKQPQPAPAAAAGQPRDGATHGRESQEGAVRRILLTLLASCLAGFERFAARGSEGDAAAVAARVTQRGRGTRGSTAPFDLAGFLGLKRQHFDEAPVAFLEQLSGTVAFAMFLQVRRDSLTGPVCVRESRMAGCRSMRAVRSLTPGSSQRLPRQHPHTRTARQSASRSRQPARARAPPLHTSPPPPSPKRPG